MLECTGDTSFAIRLTRLPLLGGMRVSGRGWVCFGMPPAVTTQLLSLSLSLCLSLSLSCHGSTRPPRRRTASRTGGATQPSRCSLCTPASSGRSPAHRYKTAWASCTPRSASCRSTRTRTTSALPRAAATANRSTSASAHSTRTLLNAPSDSRHAFPYMGAPPHRLHHALTGPRFLLAPGLGYQFKRD